MVAKIALVLALTVALVSGYGGLVARRQSGKIVGGEEAVPNSHPYIVSIQVFGSQYCGGTIINERFVVTAAHCATRAAGDYTVVAGEHDLLVDSGLEQRRAVAKITQHPNYNALNSHNDIAIFELATPFEFNDVVKAGNLAPSGFESSGSLEAVGWGTTTEGGDIPDRLQEVRVPFVTDGTCRLDYALVAVIYDNMICAGESGRDSCQGDSGGPLNFVNEDGSRVLVGITSFGIGCARPRYPGVYTEVSYFADWIAQVIGA